MADPITTWDDESIRDLISDAMSNAADMDTSWSDYARTAVKALREEGLLPSVAGAHAVLQAEAARLTAAIQAKGYSKTRIEFWIGRGRTTAYVHERPKDMPYALGEADIVKVIEGTEGSIAKTPDITAYDAWFVMPQAEAAE